MKTVSSYSIPKYSRTILPLFTIFLSLQLFGSVPQAKVKLLVIIDSSSPLIVDFRTAGNTARQVLMLGSLLDIAISEARQSNHSRRLRETVGEFDRLPILKAGIEGAFSTQKDYFEVRVTNDVASRPNKINWDNVNGTDHSFILVLDEVFAGYVSAYKLGTLSTQSTIKYELFNVSDKKSMEKGTIS